MGSNQSSPNDVNEGPAGKITVVNANPSSADQIIKTVLPERVLPILTLEGHSIDPKRHKPEEQLDHQLWVDFVTSIHRFSCSRADLVASRQSHLQEKIIKIDGHVQKFTDSYINDKHKALAKMNDDCRKIDEINKLLEKCSIQSEICVNMLNKLNLLLLPEHRLESIEA